MLVLAPVVPTGKPSASADMWCLTPLLRSMGLGLTTSLPGGALVWHASLNSVNSINVLRQRVPKGKANVHRLCVTIATQQDPVRSRTHK